MGQDESTITAAWGIKDSREAEWLVAEMKKALGSSDTVGNVPQGFVPRVN